MPVPTASGHPRSDSLMGAALAAVPLAAAGWATMVTSLVLSSADVTVGASVRGSVTIDSAARGGATQISLSSSNARVLAVPSSVTTSATQPLTTTFTATTGAAGCATVLARAGNSPSRAAMVAVHPVPAPAGSTVQLSLDAGTVAGGSAATVVVRVSSVLSSPGGFSVQLTTDNPAVATVPSAVTVPTPDGTLKVSVPTVAVTSPRCAVITAKTGSSAAAVLLKVVPRLP